MSVIEQLKNREETLWLNPDLKSVTPRGKIGDYGFIYVKAAQNRFMRYLPYIAAVFPETAEKKGVIESPLLWIDDMKEYLNAQGANITGKVVLKDDARLPIAGSVKARGGIHEVMTLAETILFKEGIMTPADDHSRMDTDEIRQIFSKYTIQVGSTGNLGIAIGRMAAKMGFKVIVHMSSDAKEWKKKLLRSEGVIVKEYDGDYSEAVAEGRRLSAEDPMSHFVDDENSKDLFFGYSCAALRISMQLSRGRIPVDDKHPLFVYIPCGVGGAPAGITFGLKMIYGNNVHCFFGEPVEAPCFTLGMASGEHEKIRVQDIGLSGKTIADGLAVGRPSGFACHMMEGLVSGCYTVKDEEMLDYQKKVKDLEGLVLEPSACAGFAGLSRICRPGSEWETYIKEHNLTDKMADAVHVVWATGGGLLEKYEEV